MGIVSKLGGRAGSYIGKNVGAYASQKMGLGRKIGRRVGYALGKQAGAKGASMIPIIGSFKKGGKVKKTGAYLLHKGELVIPKNRIKR